MQGVVFNRHAVERALVNKLTTHNAALQDAVRTEDYEETGAPVPLPCEVEPVKAPESEASPVPVGVRVVDAISCLQAHTR